jgi:hypothetical protein
MNADDGITQTTVGPAPENIRKVCDKWNLRAKASGEGGFRVSGSTVTRPSVGRVNYHLRLDLPSGKRLSVSLGMTDDKTVLEAIRAMLRQAKQQVSFSF